MNNPNQDEVNLRTFNTAKKFVEEIIFPLMNDYQNFLRMVNYGAKNFEEANIISEDIREINRFNGLKGMAESTSDLIDAIISTVISHNSKEEIAKINEMKTNIKEIKNDFYDERERFFIEVYRGKRTIEVLDRKYSEIIKEKIIAYHINTEILMTRNKILFADSRDEYASDAEIMDEIKKEYVGE